MEHSVDLVHRRGAESGVEPIPVEALDVDGGELSEFDPAESRLYMGADEVAVSVEGALPHGATHAVRKPPVEVLPNAHVLVVEDEPLVAVGEGVGQLLGDLLPFFLP